MKTLLALAVASALLSTGLSTTPAAAKFGGSVRCNWSGGSEIDATNDFLAWIPVKARRNPTAEIWNGCIKVTYVNEEGRYVTEFYDPDSKRQLG